MIEGFPDSGLKFLKQLAANNDRDWFRERKDSYKSLVEIPMNLIVTSVASRCRAKGLSLHTKERSPVMRVYRDVRFSRDKTPFKTHVGAELRRSFAESEALLYLHIHPKDSFLAAGVWQPDRPLLNAWRQAIVAHPDRFDLLERALRKSTLQLSDESSLTKLPRGFQQYEAQSFARVLRLTSFVVVRPLARAQVVSPSFASDVVKFALSAKPLLEFAWDVEETNPQLTRKKRKEEDFI